MSFKMYRRRQEYGGVRDIYGVEVLKEACELVNKVGCDYEDRSGQYEEESC